MKYNTLSKEEKRDLKNKYYATNDGKIQKNRLFRILIWSILLFLLSIYLIIDATVIDYSLLQIIYGTVIFIISVGFYIGRNNILKKSLNNYLVKKR